ncbi:MAG: hypothetical protein ABFD89_17835 [Bryobacteraceae bacterium]
MTRNAFELQLSDAEIPMPSVDDEATATGATNGSNGITRITSGVS